MANLDFSVPCAVSSADEFGELSISLNTMAENLQQALSRLEDANTQLERDVEKERLLLAERKELVDSLSHEMKTPLGIVRAYAEGLQDETDEAKKQKYAQVIVSEVERMNDLIVTLLDLSALESGAANLAITRFDFVELVETVAGRLLVDTPDADFELQYELPEQKVFVQADIKRMEQVLGNLIVNAKKNVHPGCIPLHSTSSSRKIPPGCTFFLALTIRLPKTCSMRFMSVCTKTFCSGSLYCSSKSASGASTRSRPATVSTNSTKSNRVIARWAAPDSNADKSSSVTIRSFIRSTSETMTWAYRCFLASSVSSCKPSA